MKHDHYALIFDPACSTLFNHRYTQHDAPTTPAPCMTFLSHTAMLALGQGAARRISTTTALRSWQAPQRSFLRMHPSRAEKLCDGHESNEGRRSLTRSASQFARRRLSHVLLPARTGQQNIDGVRNSSRVCLLQHLQKLSHLLF